MVTLDPGVIRKISIQREGASQSVERDATNEFYNIDTEAPVNQQAVADILDAVQALRAEDLVVEDPKNLELYGLASPASVLTLGLSGEAGISKSILMGSETGVSSVYAMVKGQDLVFTLSKAVRDKLIQPLYKDAKAEVEPTVETGQPTTE